VASSIVGFTPTTTPVVTAGATIAPQAEGGGANLFAMLLALVGGAAATPADPETSPQPIPLAVPAPDFPGLTPPALPDSAPAEAAPAPARPTPPVDPLLAKAAAAPAGKALLKDLGDALIALSDAVEAGKPIDPALENKLNDAIDAVATYLGAVVPQPPRDRQLAALVSASGMVSPKTSVDLPPPERKASPAQPSGEDTPAPQTDTPVAAASTPAPTLMPSASTIAPVPETLAPPDLAAPATFTPAATVSAVQPSSVLPPKVVELLANLGIELPAPSPAAPAGKPAVAMDPDQLVAEPALPSAEPAPAATATKEAPPALQALGLVIGRLSQRLEPQNPALAAKLDALADSLKSGADPRALSTALGLDDAATEPELIRIAEAIAAPKPAPVAASAPQPFVAARLAMPEAILARKPAAAPSAAEQPEPARVERPIAAAPAPLSDTPLEASSTKPVAPTSDAAVQVSTNPTPDAKPETKATTPAPAPANSSATPTASAAAPPPAVTPPIESAVPVARAAHAAYQTPVQQVNLPQVAFQIVRQFEAGNSRFQIRLDPAELGRIDVSLEVEKSGTVSARMVVERPETLDLMQRDQRALQLALQQAGLDPGKTNLEFSLRQNPFAQQGGMADGQGGGQSRSGGQPGPYPGDDTPQDASVNLYRGTASAGGVNLFV
jgi:flagellar hook-length control protein FliK